LKIWRDSKRMRTGRKGTLWRFLLFVLLLNTPGYAMTSEELIAALKTTDAGEVPLLESFPVKIEEKRYDFLNGGVYLRVSVLNPHHPHVLHYVMEPGGRIYRLKLGKSELERMQTDLKIEIKDPDMALRYTQWMLEVTEGPALWLVSSVEGVPFQPVAPGEDELAKRIEKAKKEIASKISTPSARPDKDGFAVTQEAVQGRNLVRYEVAVSARGQCEVRKQTLLADLPVVYVLNG
jgi:hypothetical protein